MSADTVKRVRKKLFQLAEQAAALLEHYTKTEAASHNTLASALNLLERFIIIAPASLGTLHTVELFGQLSCVDGLAKSVSDGILSDFYRQRSRVFLYIDAMQSVYDRLGEVISTAQQFLSQSAISCPVDLLSLRTVDEPHSALDLVTYCESWQACLAADLAHKSEVMAVLPTIREDVTLSPLESDEGIELLLRMHACLSAWIPRSVPGAPAKSETSATSRLYPSLYLLDRWKVAERLMWRFSGHELSLLPQDGVDLDGSVDAARAGSGQL